MESGPWFSGRRVLTLEFEILYIYRGVVRKYCPDFLIRLTSGELVVLDVKGQDTEQDQVKRRFLDERVKAAVRNDPGATRMPDRTRLSPPHPVRARTVTKRRAVR